MVVVKKLSNDGHLIPLSTIGPVRPECGVLYIITLTVTCREGLIMGPRFA